MWLVEWVLANKVLLWVEVQTVCVCVGTRWQGESGYQCDICCRSSEISLKCRGDVCVCVYVCVCAGLLRSIRCFWSLSLAAVSSSSGSLFIFILFLALHAFNLFLLCLKRSELLLILLFLLLLHPDGSIHSFAPPPSSPPSPHHFVLNHSLSPRRKTNMFLWAQHLMNLFCWPDNHRHTHMHARTHTQTVADKNLNAETFPHRSVSAPAEAIKTSLACWKWELEGRQELSIQHLRLPPSLQKGRRKERMIGWGGDDGEVEEYMRCLLVALFVSLSA